ncbi:hypothetical protein GUJ93_ZPchr0005g15928 [Zizania palustris]|uniref:CRAL/TRIO N-terminal domain-containing protein n=1 Tax=Zizania palustris TaxID=103762 RepID=A0A8J5T3W0_ZIZPA|nr:hypothetical protein GUJ93_ZPchr0005g15445 [Zizania palustris]KAG8067625.1 hypothetical protein GUJ93_ZPchr0005g15928 [Zizania palustris]KAG8067629.1 hypothetical protein GUJ93_ZPchr0005g15928 [Zizania palustris]
MSYLLKAMINRAAQEKADQTTLDEQQEKVNEVRDLVGGSVAAEMASFLSDGTIRRFLRARNWSTEQATKALRETVKWRRQYRPDTICWEDIAEREDEARRVYIADYRDTAGRAVFVSKSSIKLRRRARRRECSVADRLPRLDADNYATLAGPRKHLHSSEPLSWVDSTRNPKQPSQDIRILLEDSKAFHRGEAERKGQVRVHGQSGEPQDSS